jgi:hypothetical protein
MSRYTSHTTMLSPRNVAFVLDSTQPVLTHSRSLIVNQPDQPLLLEQLSSPLVSVPLNYIRYYESTESSKSAIAS